MMRIDKEISKILSKAKETDEYWADTLKLSFALDLEKERKKNKKSYADIAKALGTSPAYISKVFRGDANLTIDTMVKLARRLGCDLNIELKDKLVAARKTIKPNDAIMTHDGVKIRTISTSSPMHLQNSMISTSKGPTHCCSQKVA